MKLLIERTDLLNALSRVAGIVPRRATVPILSNVLLTAANGKLTMHATDLDMEAVVTAPAAIETMGKITVPAATLLDIAKALPAGAQISMSTETGRLVVTSGRSRWKLPTLDASQFPELQPEAWASEIDIGADALADVLTRTVWCVSGDMSKQHMQGVNVTLADGTLTAAAARGPQLSIATTTADGEHAPLTIPTKMVQEIIKACGTEAPYLKATEEFRKQYPKVKVLPFEAMVSLWLDLWAVIEAARERAKLEKRRERELLLAP